MSLEAIIGEYALTLKVDVSDLDASISWYEEKLGFKLDPRFRTQTWAQVSIPDIPNTSIGLNLNPEGVGTGGGVTTFVVGNIKAVRNVLIDRGVSVGPIEEPGEGVKLAFFKDLDGNSLGLRQNP